MLIGVQLIGLIVAAALLYICYVNLRKRQFTLNEYLFWTSFAVAIAVVSVFPQIIEPLVDPLAFTRALDMLVVGGFLLLTAGLFHVYQTARKAEKKVERIAIAMTLHEERMREQQKKRPGRKR